MAGVTGIEPATCGFVDHRSIHLSYTPKFDSTTDFLAAHPERFDDLVRSLLHATLKGTTCRYAA
jgi:hypothetical protein